MLKRLLAIIALSLFVAASMTACGGAEEVTPEQQQQEENPAIAI
jgi:hypothetical protein